MLDHKIVRVRVACHVNGMFHPEKGHAPRIAPVNSLRRLGVLCVVKVRHRRIIAVSQRMNLVLRHVRDHAEDFRIADAA